MVYVLYEDNHLLVLNKPAGLLTQPALTTMSLETEAKAYIKKSYQKPGEVFLHAAHRLDRVSSGIVVFARTSKALSRLNESIRKGDWHKNYLACIQLSSQMHLDLSLRGTLLLEDFLLRKEHHTEVAREGAIGAKKAKLSFRCAYKEKESALLEIELITGRYHQIRAQLSSRGCPILGDVKYGADKKIPDAIALHHYCLSFEHPVKKERLTLTAPVDVNPYSKLLNLSR